MDTVVTQTVYGENGQQVIDDAMALLDGLENRYSSYLDDSLPAVVNKNAGVEPVAISPDEFDVIRRCFLFSAQSGGLFDCTIAPLVKLWDITGIEPQVPSQPEIEQALKLVDYEQLVLDEEHQTVYLSKPGMELDFGATVKGYAVQQVLELYQQSDITGGLISLGGNVAAFGTKPDGSPFRIGIRDPQKSASDYFSVLELTDEIIATSGAYERYFEQDGVRYHHILNPKTGYPCESDLLSVTVISADGLLCDYLSTLFYMEGLESVKTHLNEADYQLIALDQRGNLYLSPSLEEHFTLLDGSPYALVDGEN